MGKNRKQYLYQAIMVGMVMLSGCAVRSQQPSILESSSISISSSISSNEVPPEENSSEASQSIAEEADQAESKTRTEVDSENESSGGSNEAAGAGENIAAEEFLADLVDIGGNPVGNSIGFSIQFPGSWTAEGNILYNEEARKIAEVLPCIVVEEDNIFDKLAEKYPDGEPRNVAIGNLPGKCYDSQTEVTEGEFAGTFNNELVYYFRVQDSSFERECLIGIKFYPAFGGGIGTQREAFQSAIQISNWHKMD